MNNYYIALLLFFTQIYWTFEGVKHTDKYIAPFILFSLSFSLVLLMLKIALRANTATQDIIANRNKWNKDTLIAALIGSIGAICLYPIIKSLFNKTRNFAEMSDVIPQVEALYSRASRGEQPYYPLDDFSWHPFPVYMPLHWLPVGISQFLEKDVRWSGFVILVAVIVLASFLWAKYGATKQKTYFQGLLISLPIVAFLQWGEMDMLITYELNIAAYYLLLGTALATRQFYLVVIGIILCLLSRYTLLFWIPIAAITLWFEQPLKKNILLWGSVLGAFLVFYIIPFISREPSILANGVLYHNGAAMGDWIGTGFPDYISWTQETGISFSIFMKEYFSGTWEQRIYTSRVVQASFMLLIFFSSIYLYFKKWKGKIHYYDFLLAFLYIEMLFFYNFGPLTYRYYLVSMMMLSSVLVFRIRTILANSK